MKECLSCHKLTNNPKFCCLPCSISYNNKNNRTYKSKVIKNICLNCNKEHSNPKFCSKSCSITYNNTGKPSHNRIHGQFAKKPCIVCGKITKRISCSIKCSKIYIWNKTKEKFNLNKQSDGGIYSTKRFLREERGNFCSICNTSEWLGKQLVLVLDHINGNSEDWSLNNLRLICPNCDSQTSTFKGRNVGKGRFSRKQRYKDGKSF